MGKKLFVGGLSWNTTDASLKDAFIRFGDVTEARVVNDRDTGRSRGFGFVTFADEQHAQSAIKMMDGQSIDGRSVKVNEAEDKPRTGGGDRGAPRGGGGGGRW